VAYDLRKAFSFLPSVNYSPPTNWAFGVITNVSLYTGDVKKKPNLSNLGVYSTYTLNHQFIVIARSTIWAKNNNYNFVGDWRYLKYPSYTYGLGPSTPLSNKELIDYSYLRSIRLSTKTVLSRIVCGCRLQPRLSF